jgi:bifunctional non-homologous end joining protein LigD
VLREALSGSKGLQLYAPLNTPVSYARTQPFARSIAELLTREHPDQVVSEMAKNLRAGKVFIDWSQNSDFKTTVCVYSLRAKSERPFVSIPVTWDELDEMVRENDPDRLCLEPEAALKRLETVGDLFAPVLTLQQNLPESITEKTAPSVPQARATRRKTAKRAPAIRPGTGKTRRQ